MFKRRKARKLLAKLEEVPPSMKKRIIWHRFEAEPWPPRVRRSGKSS